MKSNTNLETSKSKVIEYHCLECGTKGVSLDLNKNQCPHCQRLLTIIKN
jgi:DNA-directed RNA polymerase subunit RPC12/RpoP